MEDIESWAIQVDEDWSFELFICSSNSADSEASEDLSDTDVESWASIGEVDFADGESNVESDNTEAYDDCAQEAASVSEGNAEAELYDSGASHHISLFQHRFLYLSAHYPSAYLCSGQASLLCYQDWDFANRSAEWTICGNTNFTQRGSACAQHWCNCSLH